MKKQTKQNIKRYVLSCFTIYGISLLFSLFSLIFILDIMPGWLQFVVSFVFIAPTMFMLFSQGKVQGEKLFKLRAKTNLSDIHEEQALDIPMYDCVFHVLGFVIPVFAVLILSVILKNNVLQFIGIIFEFPIALIFLSVGALNLQTPSAVMLGIFLPYTLIAAGMFILGFVLKVYRLKCQHGSIRNELRTFDN